MRWPPLQFALIWHGYLLAGICGVLACVWPVPAAAAALTLLAFDGRLWKTQRLLLFAAIFFAAFFYSDSQWRERSAIPSRPPAWLEESAAQKNFRFCGTVRQTQGIPDNRLRVLLSGAAPQTGGEALAGLCAWTWENPAARPLPGQKVCLSAKIREARDFVNETGQKYPPPLLAQELYWRAWSEGGSGAPELSGAGDFPARIRQNLLDKFTAALAAPALPWLRGGENGYSEMPQAKAILLALLFGDRQRLSSETAADFADAGIAHSLALSGQHLGVAGFLGFLIVCAAARIDRNLYLRLPRPGLIATLCVPLAAAYLWLGGAPPSLLRAACMLFIFSFWLFRDMAFSGIDLLCSALLLILLWDPLAIFSVGLQLSALCVAIIALIWPFVNRLTTPPDFRRRKFCRAAGARLVQIFLISLAIQAALLPVSLALFNVAGFWFPLNVVWLPALGVFVLPLAAIGLVFAALPGCEIAARIILDIASLPCQWLTDFLRASRTAGFLGEPAFLLPRWPTFLAFAVLLTSFCWLIGNRPRAVILAKSGRMAVIGLAFLALDPLLRLFWAFDDQIRVEALDAGQGQAILLRLPQNIKILVDGGGSSAGRLDYGKKLIAPILTANAPPKLAAVFSTHPDQDHAGGLAYVLDRFRIGYVFHNGRDAAGAALEPWRQRLSGVDARIAARGAVLELGAPEDGLTLEILHPPASSGAYSVWEGNSASLVMRLSKNGEGLALFTGDAEKSTLNHLLKTGANIKSRVIFAPHHGSDRSFAPRFYEAVQPELVIASCGYKNRWNYPGKKLREWLAAKGIPLLDTGTSGKISLTFDRNCKLKTETAAGPG